MSYWRKVLIAIDQLVNAIFNGWPDETMSSRSYRWYIQGKRSWPMYFIDALFMLIGDLIRKRRRDNRAARRFGGWRGLDPVTEVRTLYREDVMEEEK